MLGPVREESEITTVIIFLDSNNDKVGLRRNDESFKDAIFINGNCAVSERPYISTIAENRDFLNSTCFLSFCGFRCRGRLLLDGGTIDVIDSLSSICIFNYFIVYVVRLGRQDPSGITISVIGQQY